MERMLVLQAANPHLVLSTPYDPLRPTRVISRNGHERRLSLTLLSDTQLFLKVVRYSIRT